MGKNASLAIGRREIGAMIIGVILYAAISWTTGFAQISGAFGGDIRPAISIPVFMGFVFGPIVGFVTGTLGNFIYDAISGYISFPPATPSGNLLRDLTAGLLINWEVGVGMFGLIPGIWALLHRSYRSWYEQFLALVVTALSIIIGVGFSSLTDFWVYPDIMTGETFQQMFGPIARVNLISAVVIVPILLFNYERLDFRNVTWLRSALLRRFLTAILVSAALPTALLSMFLTQQSTANSGESTSISIQLGLTIFLASLFTIANAMLLAQSILRPLLELTKAAESIQRNQFSGEQAAQLREEIEDRTEISHLRQVFGKMAQEVITREESLRKQVAELQIIIDDNKRQAQVAEIAESDFFRQLQSRAEEMRRRYNNGSKRETPTIGYEQVSADTANGNGHSQLVQSQTSLASTDNGRSPVSNLELAKDI